jgi:hypothetical protein
MSETRGFEMEEGETTREYRNTDYSDTALFNLPLYTLLKEIKWCEDESVWKDDVHLQRYRQTLGSELWKEAEKYDDLLYSRVNAAVDKYAGQTK